MPVFLSLLHRTAVTTAMQTHTAQLSFLTADRAEGLKKKKTQQPKNGGAPLKYPLSDIFSATDALTPPAARKSLRLHHEPL